MHLDDRHHKAGDIGELGHVDGKVLELVLLGLVEDQARAVADSIDAPQVAGRVEGWVWGAWQRHVWEAGGPRAVGGGGARGAQGAIGRVGLAAARGDGGLGALAVEQTHGGQEQSTGCRQAGEGNGRGEESRVQSWQRACGGRFGRQARSVEGAPKRSTAVQKNERPNQLVLVQMVRRAAKLSGRGGLPGGCRGHRGASTQRSWNRLSIMQGELLARLADAVGHGPAAAHRDGQRAHERQPASTAPWPRARSTASVTVAGVGPEVISLPPTSTAPRPRHEGPLSSLDAVDLQQAINNDSRRLICLVARAVRSLQHPVVTDLTGPD